MATMTAAQRREKEKEAFGAFMEACPLNQFLGIVGRQWTTMVLTELARGPRRYAEVSRAMPGVSAKMLTQTLRSLERDGFVVRTVTPAVPVQVEYALTSLGERVIPLIQSMLHWANNHMSDVHTAREHYDARSTKAAPDR
ncbi:HxlR family transcriptional regulator [Actinomadura pelletieri DSM 43383]|uniref:HxlR family transcriptional regulator n=1 Tax=Actinomadura pelletieri DSM 43383 TaxID=1120940 RepID=A0A495QZ94_9ACTN|nr:helix-turn-helix domain-containing protein [Actinomadura pelletieri]RKS79186.1 HxlR family transcriptional regulator [Actinomadura pelletieri DSM 43383]